MKVNWLINAKCLDDCKKFLGVSPYNASSNIVQGDGHFLQSLYHKYGERVVNTALDYLKRGGR